MKTVACPAKLGPWIAAGLSVLMAASAAQAEPAELSHRDHLYDVTEHGGSLFVVGHPGHLLRSTDGGKTFEVASRAGGEQALFSIDFNSKGQGAVVGRSGVVLRTKDGGKTWEAAQVKFGKEAPGLFGVAVAEDGTVVAVGSFGVIVRSTDGGKTFQKVAYTTDLPGAAPASGEEGGQEGAQPAAEGEEGGEASSEGETTGVPSTPDCPSPDEFEDENLDEIGEARLTDVIFLPDGRSLAVGEFGLVLESTDGGASFHRLNSCTGNLLYNITPLGEKRVAAVGFKGSLIQSDDAGRSWRVANSGTGEDLYAVAGRAKQTLLVGAAGTMLVREGEGDFASVDTGVHTWLVASWLSDKGEGLVVGGRSNILRTTDGGRTQQRLSGK